MEESEKNYRKILKAIADSNSAMELLEASRKIFDEDNNNLFDEDNNNLFDEDNNNLKVHHRIMLDGAVALRMLQLKIKM